MQDSYGQIKQQTQLLQTQVEASMSAMVSKQFRLNWPEPSRAYLSLILDNRGRSIASDVRAKINVSEVSVFNENTAIAQFPDWAFSVREMNPSEGDYILEHGTHLRLSEERFAWPDAIKLTGTVTYFNGFSVRTDELCVYIPGQMTFRDKAGKVQNTYPPNPLGCGQLPPQIAFWRSTQKQVSGLPANH
jgi:hypothetical protein